MVTKHAGRGLPPAATPSPTVNHDDSQQPQRQRVDRGRLGSMACVCNRAIAWRAQGAMKGVHAGAPAACVRDAPPRSRRGACGASPVVARGWVQCGYDRSHGTAFQQSACGCVLCGSCVDVFALFKKVSVPRSNNEAPHPTAQHATHNHTDTWHTKRTAAGFRVEATRLGVIEHELKAGRA